MTFYWTNTDGQTGCTHKRHLVKNANTTCVALRHVEWVLCTCRRFDLNAGKNESDLLTVLCPFLNYSKTRLIRGGFESLNALFLRKILYEILTKEPAQYLAWLLVMGSLFCKYGPSRPIVRRMVLGGRAEVSWVIKCEPVINRVFTLWVLNKKR